MTVCLQTYSLILGGILPWEVVKEESSCHVRNGMAGRSGPVKRFWAVWTSSTSCYTKIIEPLIVHFIFNDSGKWFLFYGTNKQTNKHSFPIQSICKLHKKTLCTFNIETVMSWNCSWITQHTPWFIEPHTIKIIHSITPWAWNMTKRQTPKRVSPYSKFK